MTSLPRMPASLEPETRLESLFLRVVFASHLPASELASFPYLYFSPSHNFCLLLSNHKPPAHRGDAQEMPLPSAAIANYLSLRFPNSKFLSDSDTPVTQLMERPSQNGQFMARSAMVG